jgi:hypothetical protein
MTYRGYFAFSVRIYPQLSLDFHRIDQRNYLCELDKPYVTILLKNKTTLFLLLKCILSL